MQSLLGQLYCTITQWRSKEGQMGARVPGRRP